MAYEDGDVEDLSLRQLRNIQEKMHKFRMRPKATVNIPIVQEELEELEDYESSENDASSESSEDMYELLRTATKCKGYDGSAVVKGYDGSAVVKDYDGSAVVSTDVENGQQRDSCSDVIEVEMGSYQSTSTGTVSTSRRSKRTRQIPQKWRQDFVVQGTGKSQTRTESSECTHPNTSVSRIKPDSNKSKQKVNEIRESSSSISVTRSNPIRTRSRSPKRNETNLHANRNRQNKRKNGIFDPSDSDDSSYCETFHTKKSRRQIIPSDSSSQSDCSHDEPQHLSPQQSFVDYDPFANADELMPIDNAAEATLQNENDEGKGQASSDDSSCDPNIREWYSKTASMLAGSKSRTGELDRESNVKSPSRQSSLCGSGYGHSPKRIEKSSKSPPRTTLSIAIHSPIITESKLEKAAKMSNRDEGYNGNTFYELKKVKQAERYGLKVINTNDSNLVVGEVS